LSSSISAWLEVLKAQLKEGHHPIVFCRFIPTANYLGSWLAAELKGVHVTTVTGEIDDEQRRERVAELSRSTHRILVATDCLSEGVNLQEHFDSVVHYDLPWNPNRLEQREGRVDRFGQLRCEVKTVLLYGANNPVDQVVLEVLIDVIGTQLAEMPNMPNTEASFAELKSVSGTPLVADETGGAFCIPKLSTQMRRHELPCRSKHHAWPPVQVLRLRSSRLFWLTISTFEPF
jgi:superfamily II DNA/RNA helicase